MILTHVLKTRHHRPRNYQPAAMSQPSLCPLPEGEAQTTTFAMDGQGSAATSTSSEHCNQELETSLAHPPPGLEEAPDPHAFSMDRFDLIRAPPQDLDTASEASSEPLMVEPRTVLSLVESFEQQGT